MASSLWDSSFPQHKYVEGIPSSVALNVRGAENWKFDINVQLFHVNGEKTLTGTLKSAPLKQYHFS